MKLTKLFSLLLVVPALLAPLHGQAAPLYVVSALPAGFSADLASAAPEPSAALLLLAVLLLVAWRTLRRTGRRHGNRSLAPPDLPAGWTARLLPPGFVKTIGMQRCTRLAALACLPVWMATPPCQAEALYTVTFLPENFVPADINNAGQIAGIAQYGDSSARAAIYAGGSVTDLADFGTTYFDIVAITEAGTVLGNVSPTVGDYRAFVYSNGSMQEIAGLYAYGINAGSDIAGYNGGAVLYRQGTLTELGHLGTGDFSTARAINDAGDIVGTSTIDPEFHSRQHPFLYRDGALHDLGTLDEREFNSAVAINNAGQIAGYSEGENGGMHAFFYENGVMTDLGSFGGRSLDVGDMNAHGDIVGWGQAWEGPDVTFVSRDGALVDLNTLIDPALGWTIGSALAINDYGQIVGFACRDFATCSPVRLDPTSAVPEPAAAALMLFGLLAVGSMAHRRPRNSEAAVVTAPPPTP